MGTTLACVHAHKPLFDTTINTLYVIGKCCMNVLQFKDNQHEEEFHSQLHDLLQTKYTHVALANSVVQKQK